jgi:hypothetical protein
MATSRGEAAGQSTQERPATGTGASPRAYPGTPNAERYVIAADNLRRRQLKSALLHGSSRTWREQRRIWPGVIAGAVMVVVIIAAIAVAGAFRNERELQEQQAQMQQPSQR